MGHNQAKVGFVLFGLGLFVLQLLAAKSISTNRPKQPIGSLEGLSTTERQHEEVDTQIALESDRSMVQPGTLIESEEQPAEEPVTAPPVLETTLSTEETSGTSEASHSVSHTTPSSTSNQEETSEAPYPAVTEHLQSSTEVPQTSPHTTIYVTSTETSEAPQSPVTEHLESSTEVPETSPHTTIHVTSTSEAPEPQMTDFLDTPAEIEPKATDIEIPTTTVVTTTTVAAADDEAEKPIASDKNEETGNPSSNEHPSEVKMEEAEKLMSGTETNSVEAPVPDESDTAGGNGDERTTTSPPRDTSADVPTKKKTAQNVDLHKAMMELGADVQEKSSPGTSSSLVVSAVLPALSCVLFKFAMTLAF